MVQQHAAIPSSRHAMSKRRKQDNEFSTEVAPKLTDHHMRRKSSQRYGQFRSIEKEQEQQKMVATGWFALFLAVVSLFVWPAILGPSAVLFGIMSWIQGSHVLGIWSIVLGVLSFLAYLILVPLYG